ncbi:hypothetical protein BC826DRAFT_129534 [Russula brevipes]|nr:hypothetical protein BC826DRAFT_129534 [Russula brevipes]
MTWKTPPVSPSPSRNRYRDAVRRALRERKTAEQEFGAYIALEHALQATLVRQRAAAEAARRERKLAPRSNAFSSTSTREFCAPRSKIGFHNRHFIETRPTRSRPTPPRARRDCWGALGAVRGDSSSSELVVSERSLRAVQHDSPPSVSSKPEVIPLNEKAKGKAKTVPQLTLRWGLLSERMKGALDQEMHDAEQTIKLSTDGRGAVDAKKAHAPKVAQSSPGSSPRK